METCTNIVKTEIEACTRNTTKVESGSNIENFQVVGNI